MHVTIVHVHVKKEHIADFIEASRVNHEASIQEDGNRRFDVLQSIEKPVWFTLYEAYISAEDAAKHKESAHYETWRDTMADWMAAPRKGLDGFKKSFRDDKWSLKWPLLIPIYSHPAHAALSLPMAWTH